MPRSVDRGAGRAPERRLYLVATAHLDTQWRWTVRDVIARFLPDTLRRNFERFDRYPSYILSFEGAFRYMLAREYYPREYEELKRRVAAGRWRVAGCMLDAPDVHVPSPESLVRHVLYAARFFERELGGHGRDVFLPDCFGFTWALPSVAAHCGLVGFSSSKLVRWVAPAAAPFDVGWWEGPDGSRILAALNPDGYGEKLEEDPARETVWRERIERSGRAHGLWAAFRYFGVGDRGGAPDETSLRHLEASQHGEPPVRVVHDGSDRIFADLGAEPERTAELPVHRGELLLPTHGTGCFTSQAILKRWNRANELLADAAERAALAADWLGGAGYPRARLEAAWLRFLWHQMHDDLTGTSIPAAYRISWNDEVVALNQFAQVLTDSVGAVARALDTAVEGVPLVVFNPLAAQRTDAVRARVLWSGPPAPAVRVFGPGGEEVPSQVLSTDAEGVELLFLASLPSVGFRVFDVRPAEGPYADRDADSPVARSTPKGAALESSRYRVEIDGSGDVVELFDKQLGRELLAGPVGLELLRDRSWGWPAWEIHHRELEAPARERFAAPAAIRVVASGPVRAELEVRRSVRGSTLVQRLYLDRGGDRLEVACRLRWRSRNRILKAVFPLAASNPRATYDLGLGVIERGNNRPESYEVPAQQWADLTDRSGDFGVSILNDSKYGWDKPSENTLRLSLVRSPGVFRKFVHQAVQDHGPHAFTYALHGHAGDWSEGGTAEQAARLNQPPLPFQVEPSPGTLGRELSLFEVAPGGVAVRALKRMEAADDPSWLVRLQEATGRTRQGVTLAAATRLREAREVDGTEKSVREAVIADGKLVTGLGSFAPRAFALRPERPPEPLDPPRSRPVALERDQPAASFHGGEPVDFDGRGQSMPGELLPRVIRSGGVEFHLGSAVADPGDGIGPGAHCVACRGQRLELEPGFQELAILAVAVGGRTEGRFEVDGDDSRLVIADWVAPVGQWARRRTLLGFAIGIEPPFVERAPIAWLGTHRHDGRVEDMPYAFCYLFRYRLPLAPGARRVTLPCNDRIRLFAATQVEASNFGARAARELYDVPREL